jgi:uncharacterized coiled-coil DUF342 family protein
MLVSRTTVETIADLATELERAFADSQEDRVRELLGKISEIKKAAEDILRNYEDLLQE